MQPSAVTAIARFFTVAGIANALVVLPNYSISIALSSIKRGFHPTQGTQESM